MVLGAGDAHGGTRRVVSASVDAVLVLVARQGRRRLVTRRGMWRRVFLTRRAIDRALGGFHAQVDDEWIVIIEMLKLRNALQTAISQLAGW
jgi:hypothetical protein